MYHVFTILQAASTVINLPPVAAAAAAATLHNITNLVAGGN
jgi:hypothetical protein